eukprot:gene19727-23600_t
MREIFVSSVRESYLERLQRFEEGEVLGEALGTFCDQVCERVIDAVDIAGAKSLFTIVDSLLYSLRDQGRLDVFLKDVVSPHHSNDANSYALTSEESDSSEELTELYRIYADLSGWGKIPRDDFLFILADLKLLHRLESEAAGNIVEGAYAKLNIRADADITLEDCQQLVTAYRASLQQVEVSRGAHGDLGSPNFSTNLDRFQTDHPLFFVFTRFVQWGRTEEDAPNTLDLLRFTKLVKDIGLLDIHFTVTTVDVVFAKVILWLLVVFLCVSLTSLCILAAVFRLRALWGVHDM